MSCTSNDSRYTTQLNQIQQNNTLLNSQQQFLNGGTLPFIFMFLFIYSIANYLFATQQTLLILHNFLV